MIFRRGARPRPVRHVLGGRLAAVAVAVGLAATACSSPAATTVAAPQAAAGKAASGGDAGHAGPAVGTSTPPPAAGSGSAKASADEPAAAAKQPAAADPGARAAAGDDLASIGLKPLKNPKGTVYRVTVKSRPGEQFDTGIVQVWLPKGIKQVRGLYLPGVFVNTDPGDGKPKPGGNREHLALKYHFGVVTHAFTHKAGTPNNRQAYCGYGSGHGLIRAFKKLAAVTGHPEIATAPYIMYSYSITSGCAIAMAKMYPKRMIMMSGGGGIFADCTDPGVRKIPMIMVGGRYDRATSDWPQSLKKCRSLGQPVAYALNYNGHEIGDDRPAIEPWWWSLIPRRLPARVGDPLLPVDMSRGYLGDNDTLKVVKYSPSAPGAKRMSWLPSKKAATAWKLWQVEK